MIRNEEEIKKKQFPTIFSMGFVDLIFKLELTDDDFLNPLYKSVNSVNSNSNSKYPFKFEDIKSIKDLNFLKRNKFIWDKIKMKAGNTTLDQLLIGNEYLEKKCIIDYVGYGPLKFIKKEEKFFQPIFNFVTNKNFLIINEKYLDENCPSTLTIELTYNNESLIINYNSKEEKVEVDEEEMEEEEEEENNLIENNKKTIIKRSESILFNIEPSINQYNLVFLNYSDIEKIPGDFQMNDLILLLNFFQKNGSNIFVNFFKQEKDNEEDNETESNNEKYLQKINEKRMLYNVTNIYFFETLQAQKIFQNDFEYFNEDEKTDNAIIEGNKIFRYFIDNILIDHDKINLEQKKTSIFLDNLDTLTVISLVKNKSYKKQFDCEIFPKLKQNNENLKNYDNDNQNDINEYNNDDINKYNKNLNNDINNKNDDANEYNENSNNDIDNNSDDDTNEEDIQQLIKEYNEIIEETKIDLYSILISFIINNFAYNNKNFYLFKIVSKPFSESLKLIKEKIEIKVNRFKKEKLKNIIYLIDITKSMNKYKNIIYSLEDLNKEIFNIYGNIKIGYVLYKDYLNGNKNILKSGQSHIKIIKPSSKLINIQGNEDFNFEGGDDFAEDWANPINDISHLNLGKFGNIVIHICDSGAHGKRFSNYCNKNDQEKLLIEALNNCIKNKIKILGLIINEFTKKSFSECKRIYNKLKGYYNIIDLKDLIKTNDFDKQSFINIIEENIENALINKENELDNDNIQDKIELNEEDHFIFDGINVKMKKLSEIEQYKEKKFCFLPQVINDEEAQTLHGIEQGAIGDCYLISSILSMVSNFPFIFNYIFPNLDYDENSEIIQMYVYKNGIKELISFKNTYATRDGKNLLFVKPYNNELYGICLEKGYAVSKAENSLQSGYKKIEGGHGYIVFENILGTKSEKYKSNHKHFKNWGIFKNIDKNKLKDKIKKYIDYGGIITIGVTYNKEGGHEYSLQGYKIDKKGNFFVEIINPHRSGRTVQENIYIEKDYNKLTKEEKEEFDKRDTPRISEDDFRYKEEKISLENYPKTGFLFLSYDTFYKWFGTINMCDPMFGSNTYTIEFIPDGSELYTIDFEINSPNKFKVTLTDETNFKNSKYKIQLSDEKGLIIDEDNCDLIYEKIEKGIYNLKIMLKGEIKNKVYLKMQCNDKIKINVNQENNNVLIIEDDKIFSDVYDQMENMKNIFKRLQIFNSQKKLKLFSKADDSSIYYNKKEYKEEGGVVSFPNFYFDYVNTKSGYHLKVINKFKLEKESDFIFSKSGEDVICKSKHGSYKITKDLTMTGFDKDFKNYLKSQGINDDEIKLKDIVDDDPEEIEEKEEDSPQNQKVKSGCCLIY